MHISCVFENFCFLFESRINVRDRDNSCNLTLQWMDVSLHVCSQCLMFNNLILGFRFELVVFASYRFSSTSSSFYFLILPCEPRNTFLDEKETRDCVKVNEIHVLSLKISRYNLSIN